jgi:hypothetical protein
MSFKTQSWIVVFIVFCNELLHVYKWTANHPISFIWNVVYSMYWTKFHKHCCEDLVTLWNDLGIFTPLKQRIFYGDTLYIKEAISVFFMETHCILRKLSYMALDCHQPPFGWITNDCLGTAFIVVHRRWRHATKHGIHWIKPSHSQPLRDKYSDRYWLSMQTTSSQSCDINWLVVCTDG